MLHVRRFSKMLPSLRVLAAWAALLPGAAYAQAPSLVHVTPTGAVPGTTVDVTLHGGNLAGATGVWTSLPMKASIPSDIEGNGTKADSLVVRLEIPGDAPLGLGGMRVATNHGVSEARLFLIDDVPNASESEPNNSAGEPQKIALPAAVSALMEAEQYDFYKFEAQAGKTLSFEIFARRLGSPLDPMLRLLDLQGRELAYNDDGEGIGSDCRLSYTFERDGEYLLEVRDIRFQGGGNYFYRLRCGDFPLATVPYPMGGKRGGKIEVEVLGANVAGVPVTTVQIPSQPDLELTTLAAKAQGARSSSFVELEVTDAPESLEAEPNNLPDQATRIVLPATLNGRLQRPGDLDHWIFSGKKGERFVFEGVTRRLGSPTDLYLTLLNAQGSALATADDNGMAEGSINFTFPEEGDYRLVAEDLNRRGGPEHAYRIAIRAYQPGFSLAANVQKVDVPQSGVASLAVTVQRQDYNGPITLATEGLPAGITSSPSVIAAGQNQAFLTLTAADDAAFGQLIHFRILGHAEINAQAVTSALDLTDLLRVALSNTPWPPRALARHVAAGVGPKPFFTLRSAAAQLVLGRNTSAKLIVQARRATDFKDPVTLKVEALPGNVTAEIKPIEAEKDSVEITLKAAADVPLGAYTILLTGTGKFKDQELSQPAPALLLEVRPAFELKTEVGEGKLTRAGQLTVKVTAQRHGDFAGPINLELRQLPQGVTSEGMLTIPEGKTEVEFVLKAADDAHVGPAANFTVAGKADVNGAAQEAISTAVNFSVLDKP